MRKVLGAALLMLTGAAPAMAASDLYFRVDGGGAFSFNTTFEDTDPGAPNASLGSVTYHGSAGNSVLGDAGVGYRFTPAFRVDATGSYIPYLKFSGSDSAGLGTVGTVNIRPLVGMVNGYIDFAGLAGMSASSINPYIVVGLGASNNQLGNFTINSGSGTVSFSGHSNIAFAWGGGAGIGIPLGHVVTLDVMYKYLNLGQMLTSGQTTAGTFTPIKAQLSVNTVTAGFRFNF